jgi:5-hydroxyisourate hydrolase
MAGLLTTHVLDTAHGRPAAGIALELASVDLETGSREVLKTLRTNQDGRTDVPLLEEGDLTQGIYELVFAVADYFGGQTGVSDPPFLDRVPVRFGISDLQAHYHVPLLVSPWSYSTYRGS